MLRATTADVGRFQGKASVTKNVRAAGKPGAVLTARLDAIQDIPLRSQEVVKVENQDGSRYFDRWNVMIVDTQELNKIGK